MSNPIYYKDLVAPDTSISDLIAQLTALIEKYGELKTKVQQDAQALANSLKNVSSATEQQRTAITEAMQQSEKLAQQYNNINDKEREAYRAKQQLTQATKQQQQIDKLIVQLNNSAEGSYNRLSAQYRLNKIRLNEMSEAERHGTEAGRQLEEESRRIYEQMSNLQKATGKYTLEVGHYENALRALPGPLGNVISGFGQMSNEVVQVAKSDLPLGSKALQGFSTVALGAVGAISALSGLISNAGKKMREFEQANADLSTILGVTRKEMTALTNSAMALGRSTEYTASQVTSLQTELAKLGFGQGSIIAMQKSVLEFATAVGADLGEAAAVAGSTLRAFNLTSAETDDTLATLAVATNKSALSFAKIRDSIGTVFPVANAYGLTVKDTTALLGSLANAGFDASSAATATRNILLNLANANGKLAKSLGGSVSTFDEIIDGLIQLRKSGIDVAGALELTDKRSVAAFTAFLSGAESAKELRASLEDVGGELERIEKERLNTVEGATKLLSSAWEGLILSFQKSNGAIKSVIESLTKLIGTMQKVLFPTDTFVSEQADIFTEKFQKFYAERGADAAKFYINSMINQLEEDSKRATTSAQTDGWLNRVLGFGKKQNTAEMLTKRLAGARQAAETLLSQIETDIQESENRAMRDAEKAEQDANAKKEELTKEQKKAIEAANKQRIADRKAVVEAINLEIAITDAGTDKMLELRLDKVNAERQLELEQNRQKTITEKQDEAAINAKYDKQIADTRKAFNNEVSNLAVQRLQSEVNAINLQIAVTRDGTDEMLELRLAALEKQRQIEIEQNKQKAEELKQDEAAINAKWDKQIADTTIDFHTNLAMQLLDIQQDYFASEFDLLDTNERQKTEFQLQMEKERLQKILELNRANGKELTDEQRKTIENQIALLDKQAKRLPYNNIYELLGIGLDKQQQQALNDAIDTTVDGIGSIIDAWAKEAEQAVNLANQRVQAAQTALDAEIEARNNGYANNVLQAQKELELQKQNEQQALREKERAQKAQLRIDSITQASSLITASANIWQSLSGIPVVGVGLAVAALATMWGSFAASKVRAAQATRPTEQYGDGTVELLQGGSHASGHDIDLGTTKDGKNRRAEGGEYFAIINKRNSRKYGDLIPDVINSFNNGTFADKYQRANDDMAGVALAMVGANGTDVSNLERDVRAIRKQGARSRFVDASGNTIEVYKNVTRKIIKG